ncbi:MAG: helicase [Polyangiaceae bacterium]|nr:helicase [Polyangiaceae bacterium]
MMEQAEVIAALGPTNTGKTHRAILALCEHESGMIGLPLRLLAREVFERVVKIKGADQVALITGEEKVVPPKARYWISTVEAMPTDLLVDFVAIDEIQLCAHPERGHIFTDRLLRARGRKETWLMGADSMASLIKELVPRAKFRRFPRLSALRSEGGYTLGSLPKRSAVVAFSAEKVYEIAEKLRARRGGAAIVFGGLSPRARNAQVELYESGEVDYLVATDAIGMGLNLDIERVAFSEWSKFDGQRRRRLDIAELAQIAGRAGRFQRNGFFGAFGALNRLDGKDEWAIENHRFPAIRSLSYRNSDLDYASAESLLDSLYLPAPHRCLRLHGDAEDVQSLKWLLLQEAVKERTFNSDALRLLFEVCQIPAYGRTLPEEHWRLLKKLFIELRDHGQISEEWIQSRVERVLRHGGDIESLTAKIAAIRTWTYVSARGGWVNNERFWQEKTRQVEDQLSDALHQALLERFVSRRNRPKAMMGGKNSGSAHDWSGKLHELRARMLPEGEPNDSQLALKMSQSSPEDVKLEDGHFTFQEHRVGILRRGRSIWSPEVRLLLPPGAEQPGLAERVLRRVVRARLEALELREESDASSQLRGVVYQLNTGLGIARFESLHLLLQKMPSQEKKWLKSQGVYCGHRYVFLRPAFEKVGLALRYALVGAFFSRIDLSYLDESDCGGKLALQKADNLSAKVWEAAGYIYFPLRQFSGVVMRIDWWELLMKLPRAERIEALADELKIDRSILARMASSFFSPSLRSRGRRQNRRRTAKSS